MLENLTKACEKLNYCALNKPNINDEDYNFWNSAEAELALAIYKDLSSYNTERIGKILMAMG